MEDIDKIIVDFNDSARKVMASFLEKFMTNADLLSRRNDENVFQQLQARYADSLKAQLNSLAKSYLYKFRSVDMQQLNNRLISSIEIYIHEFLRQTRLF
jgi:hypothetical protein